MKRMKLEKKKKRKKKATKGKMIFPSFNFTTMITEIVVMTIGNLAFEDSTNVYNFKYKNSYIKSMKIRYENNE